MKIQVKGTLPAMAFSSLDEAPDGEQVISEHVLTWRGLKNAIKSAQYEDKHYTETHGNLAARDVYITALGTDADFWWWWRLVDLIEDEPFNKATIQRYKHICKEVDDKMEAEWKVKEAEMEAESEAKEAEIKGEEE